jgi:hypothetical protein
MARCFERVGRFEMNGYPYGGYAFATHELRVDMGDPAVALRPEAWVTGPRHPHVIAVRMSLPAAVGELMRPEQITAFYGHIIEAFARATRARGVLLMTEAWRLKYEGEAPPDRPYGWVSKDPEREEVLMMSLEHVDFGTHIWFAAIRREPTRLEPWEKSPVDQAGKGRLTNLMRWMQ